GYLSALTPLLVKNNRRYGGYTVHIGLAILSIGIVNSAMFKVKREKVQLSPVAIQGQPDAKPSIYRIGDYEIEFTEFRSETPDDAVQLPYLSQRAKLSLFKMDGEVRSSDPPAILEPEIRLYPQTRFRPQPQRVSEPAILRTPLQDVYAFFQAVEQDRVFQFDFHRNPLMGLVWLGWMTLMAGAIWAALPMGRKRVGLAD
ncbi:MAG: cytochrome c-type biogenesis CcmF C-terminal domain-containing protein, partial [Planctomycetota bacterium]